MAATKSASKAQGKPANRNTFDLSGRVAVVTGGAQGFGRAIVERFLESGAAVAIWDRDVALARKTAADLKARGRKIQVVGVDVTNYKAIEKARDKTLATFGKIDIAINNAGIAGPTAKVWEFPIDGWKQVIDIDLTAPFMVCRALVPHMIANNYGRIVNVASIAGKEGNPNASGYSAAKAGLIGFTKSLGKELAGYDIAVNVVTPAAAKTAIFDQITQQHIDFMLSKIPRNRFVLVEELATMVTFMASQENSFTTAAVFDISGGRATY
jgi:3-oxoacyl-[acyl-carrier protein] reductase